MRATKPSRLRLSTRRGHASRVVVLNKELARKIADEGEYMPGPDEWADLRALEAAGMVEEACLVHQVAVTWQITERGKRWLLEDIERH
jgi:hypothetical protein